MSPQVIVYWDRNGDRGQSEPMAILDAYKLTNEGRTAWGKGSHWMLPVADEGAAVLKRARSSRAVSR